MVTTAEIIMKTSLLGSQETDGTKNIWKDKKYLFKKTNKNINTIL